ncbi:MAG: NAD-dependent epimerase/dehydratase family protein [Eggerthellaceae bacterium]|nr:NAD-dependent epimerase/dehydratase family protein [Eggerthellaceae bacterium]
MHAKALIFGVNGFVGPYLAQELVRNGYEVIGSDRAADASHAGICAYHQAELLDEDRVTRIILKEKPDCVINLAAISSVGQSWKMPQLTMQTNVVGSLNLLEAVKQLESPAKVLLVGSSEEYAPSSAPLSEDSKIDATNPYGISKVTQERFADIYSEQFGIPLYKVRAFNHTGVGQNPAFVLPSWCKQVAEIQASGKPGTILVGNIGIVRDFSDVRDIVRGYRLLLESGEAGDAFNLGSGIPSKLSSLLEMIVSFSSQPIEVEQDPELFRPSDNPYIVSNCSKANEVLGWNTEISIEETLKEMYTEHLGRNGQGM